jgi:hypothetical protein
MDLLDRLVIAFDRRQRRRLGIWEFTDDPDCIFRLAFAAAPKGINLEDGTVVHPDDRTAVLHIWSEQTPPMPATGPDLAWAKAFRRSLVRSLRLLAEYCTKDPEMGDVHAFGGNLALVYTPGAVSVLRRLGFEVHDPLVPVSLTACVLDAVSHLWIWLLRRAFNRGSARGIRPTDFQQRPVWLSRRTLVARYGPKAVSPTELRE